MTIIKWTQLIGFGEGRIIALQKYVFSNDICIYNSHLLLNKRIFIFLSKTKKEKERKIMHTCAFIINQILTLKPCLLLLVDIKAKLFYFWLKNNSMGKNNKQQNKIVN